MSGEQEAKVSLGGPLAWMARNSVAANLLMVALIAGGLFAAGRVKQEVFPEFDLDLVVVNVVYPGASPAEVEQGVLLAIEEEVRGIEGVKEVRSTATEGVGTVSVELLLGTDKSRALADVKSAVDRITSFPQEIERPIISLAVMRRDVISLVLYGDLDEYTLRKLAETARDELLQHPEITIAQLGGVRPYEISVEVPQENLRRYSLTLDQIAARIRAASVELPGGGVKTPKGEVLLRTTERRSRGSEFEAISILSLPNGSDVELGAIAKVIDGFRETDQEALFNGKPAAMVELYRVGDQTPIEIAEIVRKYAGELRQRLPDNVGVATWSDRSEVYQDRVNLLVRNALLGLVLVLLTLGLFLQARLAFWVTMGIPTCFAGAFIFMPMVDVSVNMISLFAFIIALGIVVDDAIVIGEAIFQRREQGMPFLQAAVQGVREMAVPVIFAVLTTIIAFLPLLFVPGVSGKFFRNIPLVVIILFSLSLVEALLILPAHLAHGNARPKETGIIGFFRRTEERFGRGLQWVIRNTYVPTMRPATRNRHVTAAACVMALILALGYAASGRIDFTFMPKIDSDRVVATLEMPYGTSVRETRAVGERISAAAQEVLTELGDGETVSRGIYAQIAGAASGGGPRAGSEASGSHLAQVSVYLVPSDQREFSGRQFAGKWREAVGEIAGAETLTFKFSTGPSADAPIDIELSHPEIEVLERAGARLAAALVDYPGVKDVDDGFKPGKEQMDFRLTAEAKAAGLTEREMARQLRAAFFGVEAARQQRGRDEVRTYVRLPADERTSEFNVEELLLRTPSGDEVPLGSAALVTRGRSYTEIRRVDGRRVIDVTADVEEGKANANKVAQDVRATVIPGLLADFPGLASTDGGSQRRQIETMESLRRGMLIALLAMFGVLAVAFRSYVQPLLIMTAIPFGIVGALVGHVLMGYDLSLISMMGIIALSGIVVNDSLILIVAINRAREAGMPPTDAVIEGAVSRFRPVLLTSLTTFFGLMPMILEPSLQARFLIPMAISLGFGVLFATFITLVFVPVAYLILDDIRQAVLGRSAPPQSNPASGQRPLPFDTDSSPGTPAD